MQQEQNPERKTLLKFGKHRIQVYGFTRQIILFWLIAGILAVGGFIVINQIPVIKGKIVATETSRQLQQSIDSVYNEQKDSINGEKTPYDLLYRYTELLQMNADKIASTYFVQSARSSEENRLAGKSYDERWQYILLLKQAQDQVRGLDPSGSTLTLSSPLKISLSKTQTGLWQIVSISQ